MFVPQPVHKLKFSMLAVRPSLRAPARMPCSIQTTVSVSMGGTAAWHIKNTSIITVGDQNFVKLKATEYGLVRLVTEGIVDRMPKNPSLWNCPGFKRLTKLRNERQAADLTADNPASDLFDGGRTAQKKARRTAGELRDMRSTPTLIQVDVPTAANMKTIPMVRPAHPCEDVCIPLDSEIIEHVVLSIRECELSAELLSTKRCYNPEELPKGVWRSSDRNGYLVKVCQPDGLNACLKRVRTKEAAEDLIASQGGAVPIGDGDAEVDIELGDTA